MYRQRAALSHRSLIVTAYVGIGLIRAKISQCSHFLPRKKEEMSIQTTLELLVSPTSLSRSRRVGFRHLPPAQWLDEGGGWEGERVPLPNLIQRSWAVPRSRQPPSAALGKAQMRKHKLLAPGPRGSCWLLPPVGNLQQRGFGCSPGAGMEPAGCSRPDPPVRDAVPPVPAAAAGTSGAGPGPTGTAGLVMPEPFRRHRPGVLALLSPDGFWSLNGCAGSKKRDQKMNVQS